MAITVKKVKFDGYGVERKNHVLHVCFNAPHLHKAGIRLFKDNGHDFIDVVIDEKLFIGDVVSVDITGCDDYDSYIFFRDEDVFLDRYAFSLSDDKSMCNIVSKIKERNDLISLPFVPLENQCIYLASVKGQTMLDNRIKTNKGSFAAFIKEIPNIKDLGITAIELMPVYENLPDKSTDYRKNPNDAEKPNYWGFGNGSHFAIKKELCISNDTRNEFLKFVNALHKASLECYLIMQFDNNENTEYILDVLKYYLLTYNVDGFRLVGATIPYNDIVYNPMFSSIKIIAEDFNFGNYKPSLSKKYKNLACLSRDFMDKAKRFAKGDEDLVSYMSFAVRENSKYYVSLRNIDDFHGFTLNDCVTYNEKHNEANNEENNDGTDYNYSWNCGEEGPSSKKSILKLRRIQARNLFLLMALCQGTPVIKAGDEWLNTQFGNNNPYCQDNETGWVKYDKNKSSKDFNMFVKNALAFRKRHIILHQPKELLLSDYMSCKVPDVSFHGTEAFKLEQNPTSRAFGILYGGDYSRQYTGKTEPSIYIIYNMHWQEKEFALPLIGKNLNWKLLYSTDGSTNESFDEEKALAITGNSYVCKPRTISILIL